ncbi:hypothetical protein [Acholeplasma laidlawii]|uniref:hypothetical protein n=1 Tax=Acholeplasma laidlawii TaxID=2148 RepID=UPI003F92900D
MKCPYCGSEIKSDRDICSTCGKDINQSKTVEKQSKTFRVSDRASSSSGEVMFKDLGFLNALNPIHILKKGFLSIPSGFKGLFKDKKRFIILIALAAVWIVLILLPYLGFNPLVVQILSFLTFAQGGTSANPLRMIGGWLGKGVYAIFFVSLFEQGFKPVIRGIKEILRQDKSDQKQSISTIIIGMGIAGILYNFLTGYAAWIKSMVGVAAIVTVLSAIALKKGFLFDFIRAITYTCLKHKKTSNEVISKSLMEGLILGFLISIGLSFLPIGYAPYIFGFFCFILGYALFYTYGIEVKKI